MSFNVETTVPSATTSVTQEEKPNFIKSDRNSAKVEEDASSLVEDDWDNDPANPRNWSIGKKWLATAIVNTIASYIWLLRLVSLL